MLEKGSEEYQLLETLCRMPKPVRGMSEAMLLKSFRSLRPIQVLAGQGLIMHRGWHDGPGGIWVPTKQGEALFAEGSRG